MPYILKHCNVTELVVPICYFMTEGRKDPAKVGMMYLCTFILLKLSGERSFGVAQNQPYQVSLIRVISIEIYRQPTLFDI